MTAPTSIDAYDIPLSQMESRILGWVEEAVEVRHGVWGDPEGRLRDSDPDSPLGALGLLQRVRRRSDRIDELLATATRARARARRAKDEAAFTADVALMTATSERAGRRVAYEAGREREADAKLSSMEERRLAHQASRLVDVTQEAYDVISQIHWQLEALRKDLRSTLHALQFESTLER